jgi:hypothetical protein
LNDDEKQRCGSRTWPWSRTLDHTSRRRGLGRRRVQTRTVQRAATCATASWKGCRSWTSLEAAAVAAAGAAVEVVLTLLGALTERAPRLTTRRPRTMTRAAVAAAAAPRGGRDAGGGVAPAAAAGPRAQLVLTTNRRRRPREARASHCRGAAGAADLDWRRAREPIGPSPWWSARRGRRDGALQTQDCRLLGGAHGTGNPCQPGGQAPAAGTEWTALIRYRPRRAGRARPQAPTSA